MTGSNEKNNNKEKRKKKKFGADPEMGYCPLSIRLGVQARRRRWAQAGAWLGAGLGAGGRWVAWALGVQARSDQRFRTPASSTTFLLLEQTRSG